MRIFEIVNPADQLALWKLISTSVWQSIEQQVRDQQRQQASQATKKKRPKLKGSSNGGARLSKFIPPKTIPQPTAAPTARKHTHQVQQSRCWTLQTLNSYTPTHTRRFNPTLCDQGVTTRKPDQPSSYGTLSNRRVRPPQYNPSPFIC